MLSKITLELDEYLWAQWKCTRVAFVSAPLGFGKSEFAHRMLQGTDVLEVDADATDVTQAVTTQTAQAHDAVLVDNIHDAVSNQQGIALASVVDRCRDTRFVFLSRAPMPGWLTPLFAKGELLVVTSEDLQLTDADISRLMVANDLTPDPERVAHLAQVTMRYPLALALAMTHLQRHDDAWEENLHDEVMMYFETEFQKRFDPQTQDLLLLIPLFDKIDDDLIMHTLSTDDGRAFLEAIYHATCFATRTAHGWFVNPGMRNFCEWERARRGLEGSAAKIARRAIDYYVEKGDYTSALNLCSRIHDSARMLQILEEHARLHPGNGSYYELERYYLDLPDDVVRSSPRLMRIRSLLASMTMDTIGSERWYSELEDYSKSSEHTAEERRLARSYLAYLDLGLPHRRLPSLLDAVAAMAKLRASDDPDLTLSVTSGMPSIINGGRDLSQWVPNDDAVCLGMSKLAPKALGRMGVGSVEVALCESKFEKGEDVTSYLARVNAVLPRIRREGDPSIEFAALGLQARILIDQGNARQALTVLDPLRRRMAASDDAESRRILANLEALRCHAWMRLGQASRVHSWLVDNAPDLSHHLLFLDRYIYLTVCQAYFCESRYGEALRLMSTLSEFVKSRDLVLYPVHYLVLSAIAAWREERDDWRGLIVRAMAMAGRYGYVRTITQYGAAVLPLLLELQRSDTTVPGDPEGQQLARLVRGARTQASYYPDFMAPPTGPTETLTETEMQVLRLICQDKSNAEIGELLGIKLPTVKTHVSHILTKLSVRRRSQAASEARRLHLV